MDLRVTVVHGNPAPPSNHTLEIVSCTFGSLSLESEVLAGAECG